MPESQHTLMDKEFATVCVNVLHHHLNEATRTVGKRIFAELVAGQCVSLTKLKMDDESLIRIDLTLDASAFEGSLNFSNFRGALQALLFQFKEHLSSEKPLKTFFALDAQGNAMSERRLYGVTGSILVDDRLNVLMLGVDPHQTEAVVLLELMFVDSTQFAQSESGLLSSPES